MDILEELAKRIGTRHRSKPRKRQVDAEGGYRTWDARHREHEHPDRRSGRWDRHASTGLWRPEAQHPTGRGGHGAWATLRRYKVLLGLAALLLLLTAGVAVGAVVLMVVLGLQVVGLLGQVDLAGLLEMARVMLLEVIGGVVDVSGLHEGQA